MSLLSPAATVCLSSLKANYQTIAQTVTPATVAAVVKANAYGLGARVAPALVEAGCTLFFVAWPSEGQAVRQAFRHHGINDTSLEIAVLYGFDSSSVPLYRLNRLIPVLSTTAQYQEYQQHKGLLQPMLQLETGMNRSGYCSVPPLPFKPRAIFSHLACADEPAHPLNHQQQQTLERLRQQFPINTPWSLGASWASLALPSPFHGDFVRVGAALYGAIPHPSLKPVLTLTAPVLEVRRVDSGSSVGYGAAHACVFPSLVATVGIGYADGYPRALGNGRGRVMLSGQVFPVIGRVSMDLLTIDITGLTQAQVDTLKTAEIYGAHYTVNDAAADAGTIGYEILTRLGGRTTWNYTSC